MKLFLLSVLLIGLAFAGIAIKIWAKKDGEFAGTCASQSPFLNKDGEPCGLCGKMPAQQKDCDLPHPQQN
ncbi:MAG: membrane or secreted protein [Bacteroidota bacterium]|nr:membrane or secreted protein [Bacteroidota bacterium]MEC8090675.1 membrane or secreted protein [Bacteroidota bacterium]MEC8239166.1 membrane or secreted protein [Bacteroidota bacterium]|tara:strand:- start:487 stop:696 length:210 start_codon:yes stop_codon:yes gene_type:complete